MTGIDSESEESTAQGTSLGEANYVDMEKLPTLQPPEEFKDFIPQNLTGLKGLKKNPNTLSAEISQIGSASVNTLLGNIQGKYGAIFIEPDRNTEKLIFYEVYKFPNEAMAKQALGIYKNNWNNKHYNSSSGKSVWIWEGFRQGNGYQKDSVVLWDPNFKEAYYSNEPPGNNPVISSLAQDLYCLHGEAAMDEYFLMIDVHAPREELTQNPNSFFENFLEGIPYQPDSTGNVQAPPSENLGTISEGENVTVEFLEKRKAYLDEQYVLGNLDKDTYERLVNVTERMISELKEGE